MSNYIQFEATESIIEPAKEEKVYDKYWLANFRIEARDPKAPVRAVANFVPARDVTVNDPETGEEIVMKEVKENSDSKRLVISNLFGEAVEDPEGLGTVINNVLLYLKNRAISEGVI